jgi:hypothetical protein
VSETELEELVGSSIDRKNIELSLILFSLRHDLDIHCLIGVNASQIKKHGPGTFLFGHVAMRVLESIVLAICKVYEDEKRYELNSIQGVLNSLAHNTPSLRADEKEVRGFVSQYGGPFEPMDPLEALQATFDRFKTKYSSDLNRFKTARDKLIAHSEFGVTRDDLPSFDTMENLFLFGADFYMVVSNSFVGSGPVNLKDRREIKRDLEKILRLIGLQDIKTEME